MPVESLEKIILMRPDVAHVTITTHKELEDKRKEDERREHLLDKLHQEWVAENEGEF